MKRLLFIASFEYLRQITRRAFIITLLTAPIVLVIMLGSTALMLVIVVLFDPDEHAIGYVDHADIVREEIELPDVDSLSFTFIPFHKYSNEPAANKAFAAGSIDAYVVIPANYLDTGIIQSYANGSISRNGNMTLRWILRRSLWYDLDPNVASRSRCPTCYLETEVIQVSKEDKDDKDESDGDADTATGRQIGGGLLGTIGNENSEEAWFIPIAIMVGMMFVGTMMSSSSYLLQALIDEKENRTMEIVVTSVAPEHLIGGKTLGLGALGLTQSLVWASFGLGPVVGGALIFEPVRSLFMGAVGSILPLTALFFVPFYLMYASIIVTIGAMVGSVQEGQQLASFVMLPAMIPIFLVAFIIEEPDSLVSVISSLVPLTAPMTIMVRLSVSTIPVWQVILSLAILTGSAILMIFISARIFRWGMLRYGKKPKWREVLSLLKAKIMAKRTKEEKI